MIYSPETKHDIKTNSAIIITLIILFSHLVKKKLLTLFALILFHHVQLAQSSSSLPMLSLPLLSTDYLYFPPVGGQGPSLAPFPQVDPIFLRSQATARSHARHNNRFQPLDLKNVGLPKHLFCSILMPFSCLNLKISMLWRFLI
jgi:hypothetical protein